MTYGYYDYGSYRGRFTPKPTKYKGIQFRSRLEAQWAMFFDACGWEWEYEPEVGLIGWIPDFLIRGQNEDVLVEVKPYNPDRMMEWQSTTCKCMDAVAKRAGRTDWYPDTELVALVGYEKPQPILFLGNGLCSNPALPLHQPIGTLASVDGNITRAVLLRSAKTGRYDICAEVGAAQCPFTDEEWSDGNMMPANSWDLWVAAKNKSQWKPKK